MQPTDIYLRRVDLSGKRKPVITHHRAWDRDLFLAEQHRLAREAREKDPRDAYQVEIASQAEYEAQRKR